MLLLKGEGVQRGQRGGRGQKNSHEFPGNPRSSQDSQKFLGFIQSGASSRAKHGGAYFLAVIGSIKDPIAVPGRDLVQEC